MYLLYQSWCWGWWGRDNLILQYYLQCKCPRESEQARFPSTEILVSACENQEIKDRKLVELVKKGYVGSFGVFGDWVLELEPGDTTPIRNYYLLNVKTGQHLSLKYARTMDEGKVEPNVLEALRAADKIYSFNTGAERFKPKVVVALVTDFVNSGENWLVESSDGRVDLIPGNSQNKLFKHSSANTGIMVSKNHLFQSSRGIELTSNHQQITPSLEWASKRFQRVGWAEGDRGVIYYGGSLGGPYMFGPSLAVIVPTGPVVPQPVVLLQVPKEYLSLHLQQEFETHQVQEQTAIALGNFRALIALGLFVVLAVAAWWIGINLKVRRA